MKWKKEQERPQPQESKPNPYEKYSFTHDEIDLISMCIQRTTNYYKGLLLMQQDFAEKPNDEQIAYLKAIIRLLDDLQERTSYIGQSEIYKNR